MKSDILLDMWCRAWRRNDVLAMRVFNTEMRCQERQR